LAAFQPALSWRFHGLFQVVLFYHFAFSIWCALGLGSGECLLTFARMAGGFDMRTLGALLCR